MLRDKSNKVIVKRFEDGELLANGYIIYSQESEDSPIFGYIIDPGYKAYKYINFLGDNNIIPKGILMTHGHFDHVGAGKQLREHLNIPLYIHKKDEPLCGYNADYYFTNHQILPIPKDTIEVLFTPGHTKGSCCFYLRSSKVVFTGDTIFDIDLGRTDLKGGSPRDMKQSVRKVINKWENDIYIYPGHDTGAYMEDVRKYNKEFLSLL